jgi:hypothetical protein
VIPNGTRTAFRAEGERFSERSDAGNSIVREVFAFVKRNLSGVKRRKGAASGERGAVPFPASAHSKPERGQRSARSLILSTKARMEPTLLLLFKTCRRHANRLPKNQLELASGPPVISRGAIAGVLEAALYNQKVTVGLMLLALVNNPRRLHSEPCIGPDIDHARG